MPGLQRADFEPHLTSTFQVLPVDTEPVTIELIEVNEINSAAMDGFSLMFKGGTQNVFRHNTHTVHHPVMGHLELFLGPVHTGHKDAVYYQAIFSNPKVGGQS